MFTKKIEPPTYLLIALLAMVALHFLWPLAYPIPRLWRLAALLPLAGGIALNFAADRAFQQAGTTVKPLEASSALITTGPFRLSRNPMYLGFGLVLLGVALMMGSLTPFLVIPLFVLLIDRLFIRVEEGMLAERFGQNWLAYKAGVRRWL